MTMVKVWLGGEGGNDIGDSDQPAMYRKQPGALEALLRRAEPDGWDVLGATRWKRLRNYVAGSALGKEERRGPSDGRNVKGLLLQAREKGAQALAFLRDIDNHDGRDELIEQALNDDRSMQEQGKRGKLALIAGFPRPALEAWLLAFQGRSNTDEMSKAKLERELKAREVTLKDTEDYVSIIEQADLEKLPPGCESLQRWCKQAEQLRQLVNDASE